MAALRRTLPRLRQRDTFNSSDLPSELSYDVPFCAQSCLLGYIQQDYSCDSTSLSCLCSTTSSEGFTLGELAYGCLMKACSDASDEAQATLYRVCSAQPSAVAPTHTVLLSLPPLTALSHSSTTSSVPPTTSFTTSSTSTTASHSSQQHSSTSVPAAASSSPTGTELTTAQAIGISIGAMGGLISVVAILMIVLCLRKRRLQKAKPQHDSYDFIDEAPSKFVPAMIERTRNAPPPEWRASERTDGHKRITAWPLRTASRLAESKRWSKNQHGAHLQATASKRSRRSAESTRTLSQLLPEKPQPLTYKKEEVVAQPPDSPTTVIDDDPMSPHMRQSQTQPVQLPAKAYKISNTTPKIGNPQTAMSFDMPQKSARTPTSANAPNKTFIGLPSNPRDGLGHDRQLTHRSIEDNIPTYYTALPTQPAPRAGDRHKRKVAPARIRITHAAAPPRAVRSSAGSDTSFESTDDEATPPDQRFGLGVSPASNVQYPKVPRPSDQTFTGSPQARPMGLPSTPQPNRGMQRPFATPSTRHNSPGSMKSSAMAMNGFGGQRKPDYEPDFLMIDSAHASSKKISPNAAAKVADSSASKRYYNRVGGGESPLRGYGRTTTSRMDHNEVDRAQHDARMKPTPRTPDSRSNNAALGSPMAWEPRITPTKRGEDLYLNVNLSTPGNGIGWLPR